MEPRMITKIIINKIRTIERTICDKSSNNKTEHMNYR